MPENRQDHRFELPALDQPSLSEIGVILSGLATDRLLAGLGLADDGVPPSTLVLRMDLLRHTGGGALAGAVAEGARRWRAARPLLGDTDHAPSMSASIRQAWQRALRTVLAAEPAPEGADSDARHAVLATCWLRCAEMDTAADAALAAH